MGVVGQVMGASSSAWRWLRREFALAVPLICGVCVPLAAQLPATALANDLPVYTCNPGDVSDIEGLEVVAIALPDGTAQR